MRKTLMLFVLLCLPACAGKQAIVTIPPARCADLVPDGWKEGVEATPIPADADTAEWIGKPLTRAIVAAIVAPWASAYVGMSGQLEKANGRITDSVGIVQRCEAMVNAARPGAKK